MAVLVNVDSYSAAEFFAAALQEYEAATVVGVQTYGKGRFQTALQLSDGSAVNLSIGEYFTPEGKSLAGVGITPDVVVELDETDLEALYYGELPLEEDEQLQAAFGDDAVYTPTEPTASDELAASSSDDPASEEAASDASAESSASEEGAPDTSEEAPASEESAQDASEEAPVPEEDTAD